MKFLVDGRNGWFVPQMTAAHIDFGMVTNGGDLEDLITLLEGPRLEEDYWTAWNRLLNNLRLKDYSSLWQDYNGDTFLVALGEKRPRLVVGPTVWEIAIKRNLI